MTDHDGNKLLSSDIFTIYVLLARYALYLEDVDLGKAAEMPTETERTLGRATADIGAEIQRRAVTREQRSADEALGTK